jgi:FMN phosphatase YigB (HAD superfamily)
MVYRKVIVWDVDDVLNCLTFEWFKEFAAENPAAGSYDQLKTNPPLQETGLTLNDYLASLDDFRQRRLSSMIPAPEVLTWFRSCGDAYRHVAMTAVPAKFAPLSAEWVLRHFGLWFRSYHFVPSFRSGETMIIYDECKADLLRSIGKADYFIDDNEKNVSGAADLGITALVFPQPWNRAAGITKDEFFKNIL